MKLTKPRRTLCSAVIALLIASPLSIAPAQLGKPITPERTISNSVAHYKQQRAEWFLHGRTLPGNSSAQLRYRAYQAKMRARVSRPSRALALRSNSQPSSSSSAWIPLGPLPLASDATGDGFQDYHQVAGRATSVAIDPADPSGNTVFIGGAQGGVWKSANAASTIANNVTWTPITDDQATLSIGTIAIQPGNVGPAQSVILAGTGEANNSADSYFGLGFLRSADSGNTWTLIPTANSGALSFKGLGAARIAFSTAQPNTVVAAMAATSEGIVAGALTGNMNRGLYTSTDAGMTWTYNTLFPGGPSEATSATSVVYNAVAGLFFAALRYHGFYSSPDGVNWTSLANQPGAPGLLNVSACPQNYSVNCPIYRGEITVVPGRNEMYVWFISLDSNGSPEDQGIWQSENGGVSWTQIADTGITDCGDSNGCGVDQGAENLALLAVPDGASATDLYGGAVNLYKCSINSSNPTCAADAFLNLTHAYGCIPLGALAHVHPGQHTLAYTIPLSAVDLMYFANDGGVYRTLNGFTGLATGSCSGSNQFDDLNQNLGSMIQFVSFSQHPTESGTLLGGAQDNGSPATTAALTSTNWGSVLSGDGGYNAIDTLAGNWYTSQPDTGLGALNIQVCPSGINCNDSLFNPVVSSGDVGGDDGSFYFPYILDPQSPTALLVGTCRVWDGPRSGGTFTALSLNFDTLGIGTCAGTEVNVVRALAAGGPVGANGSTVMYATTDGPGPNNLSTPIGGNVWVTTNATAVLGTVSSFVNVTMNGPGGVSINPNQFPISNVAIDPSDGSGSTAYVTIMGFTGGPGHVWQTTNAGGSWTDFTGSGVASIPDSPANAVAIDSAARIVYVGTDVGVFESSTSSPAWTEVGPTPNPAGGSTGFLPDVAVTALAIFDFGGQKFLRASTYGRGIWQFELPAVPDFLIAVPNSPLTVFVGSSALFTGTLTAVNGYSNSVALSCTTAGSSLQPSPCIPSQVSSNWAPSAPFTLSVSNSTVADYYFNLQAAGSDGTTHDAAITLHVVDLVLTAPSPGSVIEPRGAVSPPVSFQVTAQGTFSQSVTLSCGFTPAISGASCAFTPGPVVNPTSASSINMTATVTVPAGTVIGNYNVTLQATTTSGAAPLTTSFALSVVLNPDFVLSEPAPFPIVNAGSTTTSGSIAVAAQDSFSGAITLSCALATGTGGCLVTPASVTTLPATAIVVVNATGLVAGANQFSLQGTSSAQTHTLAVPFNVADYQISGPTLLTLPPNGQGTAILTLTPSSFYDGTVSASCNTGALADQCSVAPNSASVVAGTNTLLTATINVPTNASPGSYTVVISTQDVSGAPSHSLSIPLTIIQDFTLSSLTPATQTINSGQSASYNFSALPVGASFTGAVSFSCSSAPLISALCSFAPNPVTPGSSSAAVVMTISTTSSAANRSPLGPNHSIFVYLLWLALPSLAMLTNSARRKKAKRTFFTFLFALFLLALLLSSCGGGGSNGGGTNGNGGGGGIGQQQGTQPGTYTITVTGTSGTFTHAAPSTVVLIVSQ